MGRVPLIRTSDLPYHLFGRANNREWFYLPMPQVWNIFTSHLSTASERFAFRSHAFVLMSNHYHLVATAAGESVDTVMAWLLKRVSDDINRRADRANHVFGGPYKWTLMENWFQFHHVVRYVYQNPLRADLCRSVANYRFSTLRGVIDPTASRMPIHSHSFEALYRRYLQQKGVDWAAWLNEPYDQEHREAMRRALYRRRFKFSPERISRRVPSQFRADELTK